MILCDSYTDLKPMNKDGNIVPISLSMECESCDLIFVGWTGTEENKLGILVLMLLFESDYFNFQSFALSHSLIKLKECPLSTPNSCKLFRLFRC